MPTRQEGANSRECKSLVIAKITNAEMKRSCAFDYHHCLPSPLSSLCLPSKGRALALGNSVIT